MQKQYCHNSATERLKYDKVQKSSETKKCDFFCFFFNLQYSLKLSFKKCTEKEWEYA